MKTKSYLTTTGFEIITQVISNEINHFILLTLIFIQILIQDQKNDGGSLGMDY